jgi:hypothetical protein
MLGEGAINFLPLHRNSLRADVDGRGSIARLSGVSAIRSPSRYRRGQHHVEWSCAALDDLPRDQHLIDTIEAW